MKRGTVVWCDLWAVRGWACLWHLAGLWESLEVGCIGRSIPPIFSQPLFPSKSGFAEELASGTAVSPRAGGEGLVPMSHEW